MKKIIQLAVINTVLLSVAFAGPLVVYGEDNRHEVYEASDINQLLAKSTAAMIAVTDISAVASIPGSLNLNQHTLTDWLHDGGNEGVNFCDGTRYVDQINPAICSGFLIAPDLIVTAGHCVAIENMCDQFKWVFDYNVNKDTKLAGMDIREENVYKCKKVVSNALSTLLGLDYGVIQLDRAVTGRVPLEINNGKKVSDTQSLVLIGNPSGLPTKVADGANVRNNSYSTYFSANTDSFSGNSGSAVFNADTGVVEGILVRGEEDYIPNYEKMCIAVKYCATDACRGEDVSRMTSIPEVALHKYLMAASISGDMVILDKILSLNTWVDFNTKDGQSALIKASGAAKTNVMKALIARGAEVNKQDAKGNTALHELAKVLKSSNAEALKILLAAGARLDVLNLDGETALAVAKKSSNMDGAKLIISEGTLTAKK